MRYTHFVLLSLSVFCVCSCACLMQESPFTGQWRGTLETAGGDLPFRMEIVDNGTGEMQACVYNGIERLPFSRVEMQGKKIRLIFDHYDSFIEAEPDADGGRLVGAFFRNKGKGPEKLMNFTAYRDQDFRFEPPHPEVIAKGDWGDVSGAWNLTFGEGDDAWPAHALLSQDKADLSGTMLTRVGDFRYLAGSFIENKLKLSVFDGAHCFLFVADLLDDGTLKGAFYSGATRQTPWIGVRGKNNLPDPFNLSKVTSADRIFSFDFPDSEGNRVTNLDARFKGKPVILFIFGSWCPNCHDGGEYLAGLYRKFHDRGLQVVGLACEFSDDPSASSEMVRRFKRMYDIDWPVLLLGTSSKAEVSDALPDLDRLWSYPTFFFIDRDGKVQKVYTGFRGPATGDYFSELQNDFMRSIEAIL